MRVFKIGKEWFHHSDRPATLAVYFVYRANEDWLVKFHATERSIRVFVLPLERVVLERNPTRLWGEAEGLVPVEGTRGWMEETEPGWLLNLTEDVGQEADMPEDLREAVLGRTIEAMKAAEHRAAPLPPDHVG